MNQNLQTAQSIYEAFGKGDIPFIISRLSEDVQWESWTDNTAQKAEVPWMLARSGRDAVIHYFEEIGKLSIKEFSILAFMDGGNKIAVEFVLEADVPATGRHYRDEEIHLWTFNETGEISGLRHYLDTAKHMHAAGKD
jgi:ketosteroid isomerase-like protein